MIHNLYSVFDTKAEAYLPPFVMQTDEQAKRAIANAVNDTNHEFCKNPDDYILYAVGSFDDSIGTIVQEKIMSLGVARDFKIKTSLDDLFGKIEDQIQKLRELSK